MKASFWSPKDTLDTQVLGMLRLAVAIFYALLMLSSIAAISRQATRPTFSRLSRSTTKLSMSNVEKLSKSVLVAIADGSEEIEAVTIVDTLVRKLKI